MIKGEFALLRKILIVIMLISITLISSSCMISKKDSISSQHKHSEWVKADKEKIEQVFTNLIHNAIKFTPESGTITIATQQDKDHVLVSVSDTGIGISTDDLPRIFERFYKADKARSGKGTGLGLAIAKQIVELHNGKIWVESQEGTGSTFYFTIPI